MVIHRQERIKPTSRPQVVFADLNKERRFINFAPVIWFSEKQRSIKNTSAFGVVSKFLFQLGLQFIQLLKEQ